jgi:hypothetical protein
MLKLIALCLAHTQSLKLKRRNYLTVIRWHKELPNRLRLR